MNNELRPETRRLLFELYHPLGSRSLNKILAPFAEAVRSFVQNLQRDKDAQP